MISKRESPVAFNQSKPIKGNIKKVIQHTHREEARSRILASVLNQATYTEAVYRKGRELRKGYGRRIESLDLIQEVETLNKDREALWLLKILNDLYNNILHTCHKLGIHVTQEHLLLSLMHYYSTKYERTP